MFVLMQCIDRELSADFYPEHGDAWKAMLNCMLGVDSETMEDYDSRKDSRGYVENDDTGCHYEILENSAWMNPEGEDMHCDWKIIEVPGASSAILDEDVEGVDGHTRHLQGIDLPIMVNSIVEDGSLIPSEVSEMHIGEVDGVKTVLITPLIVG